MGRASCLIAVLSAGLFAVAFARGQQAGLEPRDFKPARVAVVDIAEIFENYEKKKDLEKRLELEIKEEEKKFQEQQKEFEKLKEEMKNLQAGTDKHKDLTLRIGGLEYELKSRQQSLIKQFQEKQMSALKTIREEITADIKKYAEGLDLDIILEKQVAADSKGGSLRWPIVHFAKPELEITSDIVTRLNTQYGKPSQPAAGGSGSGK